MVRARVFGTARIKIGSGKHLHSKIYPSRTLFFGTRTIFIRAVPKIRCSVNGPLTSVVFLDLAKAFDSVDHSILLRKLQLFGISERSLGWFFSHLDNRQQKCCIDGKLSDSCTIKCGVPQGSILGPLLFLIYINNLPTCLKYSRARMYADDTTISVAGNTAAQVETP